ncbi:SpaH/EbpB family LPXTG-anchored major pilin [Enterococcus songbeiensis]|uniref:SpaH/EbpB family LPXTG-anchored major pilin n=1 Tax=Enterococcus songbeiensis TaxID=2559927 RepID=UPI001485B802|nr:SpaH/EbpB family LPXTG-anchored major pilin [Enterococcus songbeiensis]
MKAKKIFGLLATGLMALPLLFGAMGAGNSVDAQETSPTDGHVNVTVHKRVWKDSLPETDFPKQNTGELMDFGGEALNGAEFTVYDVTNGYYDLLNDKDSVHTVESAIKYIQDNAADFVEDDEYNMIDKGTTSGTDEKENILGQVTFENLPLENDDRDAVYLFIETAAPTNITEMAQPMVISMPIYALNSDGTPSDKELNDIHLYPKNIRRENKKELLYEEWYDTKVTVGEDTYYDLDSSGLVGYGITVYVPADLNSLSTFTVTDTPDEGLIFYEDENGSISIDGLVLDEDYEFTKNPQTGGFTIEFDLESEKIQALSGSAIRIEYRMQLTGDVLDAGLANNAEIVLGTTSETLSAPKVGTHGHKFVKTNAHTGETLLGAKFKIYQETPGTGKAYAMAEDSVVNGWSVKKDGTVFTSDSEGKFEIKGLKTGTYMLEEIEAPDGFIITDEVTEFEVKAGGYADVAYLTTVKNTPKGLLPATGGNGIIALLAIGFGLMLGAFVWYKNSKKQAQV